MRRAAKLYLHSPTVRREEQMMPYPKPSKDPDPRAIRPVMAKTTPPAITSRRWKVAAVLFAISATVLWLLTQR